MDSVRAALLDPRSAGLVGSSFQGHVTQLCAGKMAQKDTRDKYISSKVMANTLSSSQCCLEINMKLLNSSGKKLPIETLFKTKNL